MKKILKMVSILAMISLLAVSFSSCKPRPLAIKRVVHSWNLDEELKKFESYAPPAEKNITFRGKDYRLAYKETCYDKYNLCPDYFYREEGEAPRAWFYFTYNDVVTFDFLGNHGDVMVECGSVDSCITKAKEILSEYINVNDITQYQISTSKSFRGYFVTFTKYVDDIETADFARLDVGFDGECGSLIFGCFNRIPSDLDTDLFNMKAIRKAFLNQVKKDYSTDDVKVTDDKLSEEKYLLVRGYDGQYALQCIVTLYEHTVAVYYVFLENRFPD